MFQRMRKRKLLKHQMMIMIKTMSMKMSALFAGDRKARREGCSSSQIIFPYAQTVCIKRWTP